MVISVINLLTAILLPVFGRARESARRASCLSNGRQLGAAVMQYTQDHDERFPQTHPTATPWTFAEDETTLVAPWRALMEPYVRTPRLFQCPSDWSAPGWHPSSYGPNGYTVYGASLADVARPSKTIYLAELALGGLLDFSPWYGFEELRATLATSRHGGGSAYLFFDGHVRWLPFDRTLSPLNLYRLGGP